MTFGQRVSNWRYALATANPPPGVPLDGVTKWLVVTRAAVFSMTVTSGLIGGLLAISTDPAAVHYGYLALAIVGLVAAHAANNMINDYFDQSEGIDTDEYVRALYAPHPVLSGWLTLFRPDWLPGASLLAAPGAALFVVAEVLLGQEKFVAPGQRGPLRGLILHQAGQVKDNFYSPRYRGRSRSDCQRCNSGWNDRRSIPVRRNPDKADRGRAPRLANAHPPAPQRRRAR